MNPNTILTEEDLEHTVDEFMMAVETFKDDASKPIARAWFKDILASLFPVGTAPAGKHPLLHDYEDNYRSPMQIIEAIKDAGEEMNYSNYHNGLYARAIAIIAAWCKAEGVEIGRTQAEHQQAYREKQDAERRARRAELEGHLARLGELEDWIEQPREVGPPAWLREYSAKAQAEEAAKAEDQ